jgi:hypothetical protein
MQCGAASGVLWPHTAYQEQGFRSTFMVVHLPMAIVLILHQACVSLQHLKVVYPRQLKHELSWVGCYYLISQLNLGKA